MKVSANFKEKDQLEPTAERKLRLVSASTDGKNRFRIGVCENLFSRDSKPSQKNPKTETHERPDRDAGVPMGETFSSTRTAIILGVAGGLILGYFVGRRSR